MPACSFTFNVGFEVWVLVDFINLFPPVKIVPPVRDDLLQVLGVEAIVKLAVLQRRNRASLVYPPVEVLVTTEKMC